MKIDFFLKYKMTERCEATNLVVRDNAENREAINLVQFAQELVHIKQELNELNTFMSFFDQIMHDVSSASLEETKFVPAGLSASLVKRTIIVKHLTIGLYRLNLNIVSELIGQDSTWMGSFICQLNKLNNARNALLRSLIETCTRARCERSAIVTRELTNLLQ